MEEEICSHIRSIEKIIEPKEHVCSECIKTNSTWLHLRTCQNCGATLCCDSSPNLHMTQHFKKTGHPVVISAEQGEKWLYCYADDTIAGY